MWATVSMLYNVVKHVAIPTKVALSQAAWVVIIPKGYKLGRACRNDWVLMQPCMHVTAEQLSLYSSLYLNLMII